MRHITILFSALTLLSAASVFAAPKSASVTSPAIPAGALDNTFLKKYVAYRKTLTPRDRFSALPSEQALIGKRFEISLPLTPDAADIAAGGTWDYDARTGLASITLNSNRYSYGRYFHNWESEGYPSLVTGYDLTRSRSTGGTYTGTNAFGVAKTITVVKEANTALVDYSNAFEKAMWKVSDKPFELSADDARKLLPGSRLILTGVIHSFNGHDVTSCSSDHTSPTLDSPKDVTSNTCIVTVRFDEIKTVYSDGTTISMVKVERPQN